MKATRNTNKKTATKNVKQFEQIERLKYAVNVYDIDSYCQRHDMFIIDDYGKLNEFILCFHSAAYMDVNGVLYYEIACGVKWGQVFLTAQDIIKNVFGFKRERKITDKTRLFIPWRFDKYLTRLGQSEGEIFTIVISIDDGKYKGTIRKFARHLGNQLDLFEEIEQMLIRHNISVPEFYEVLNIYHEVPKEHDKPGAIAYAKFEDADD